MDCGTKLFPTPPSEFVASCKVSHVESVAHGFMLAHDSAAEYCFGQISCADFDNLAECERPCVEFLIRIMATGDRPAIIGKAGCSNFRMAEP